MGNDVDNVPEVSPSAQTIKVHAKSCSELQKLVIVVSKILPEIEASRPRCSTGLDALCSLNDGITRAKSLIRHCSESSVLYLAFTGDAIILRCKKCRNILEQSLSQIQSMVPVVLAAKISGVIADLRNAAFHLDPPEEEAGKALEEFLHRYASASTYESTEEVAISVLQSVSSWLRITSQKALLIEKRSIRKLLDEFGEREPNKKKILLVFLNLLKKFGKYILKDPKINSSTENEDTLSYRSHEAQVNIFSRPVPPNEFICPLTLNLMYDPVDIASGQTYERMWIKKWIDEGNDTCPATNSKLSHFLITSNTSIKDKILKWCDANGVSIPDPKYRDMEVKPWETSSNSIASLSYSMNNLNLTPYLRYPSFGSTHGSYTSSPKKHDEVQNSHVLDDDFFSKFSSLPWNFQCNGIKDVKRLLDKDCSLIESEKFIPLLLRFLKEAHEILDLEALMSGCLILLELTSKDSNSISYMEEDAYAILTSFLDTNVSKQALSIFGVLSLHRFSAPKFAASGAFVRMLNILCHGISELLEPVLKVFTNLSSNGDLSTFMVSSDFIPKMIPLFEDDTLRGYCITILKNLCSAEGVQVSIAKTNGCIGAIVKLLETGSHDVQEYAVFILLTLCRYSVLHRKLVVDEGVFPGLVHLSVNGNNRATVMARELLRILRDQSDSLEENSRSDVITDSTEPNRDKKHTSAKAPGTIRKLFSKVKLFN